MVPLRVGRGDPGYGRVVGAVALAGTANFALVYYVQPLLPVFARDFGVTAGASGLVLSATTVAMIGGLLVAAPLSARIGRVAAIRWSLVATGLVGMVSVLVPVWEVFLAARLLMGVGLAILPAAALAHIKDVTVDAAHLPANATYIAGTAVGGAIGRVLPLPLAEVGGWQLPTLVISAVSVAAGLVLLAVLPTDAAPRTGPAPPQQASRGIRDFALLLVCLVGAFNSAVFVATYNAIAFRLSAPPFGLGAAEALVYLAYAVCVVAPAAFGALAARRGRTVAVAAGLALVAVAAAVLVPATLPTMFAGLALATVAYMGVHSLLSGWATRRGAEIGLDTSRASSAYLIAFYLGSTAASAGATELWSVSGWPGITALSLGLVAVSAVLLGFLARRREPQGRPDPAAGMME